MKQLISANPSFTSELNKMTSEIISSTPYMTIFKYCLQVQKMMTMISVYNAQEVSFHGPTNINFIGTKAVLKDILETIYDTKGKDSYKNESSSIKESGGPIGISMNAQKKTS